jgi:hypothetical protein
MLPPRWTVVTQLLCHFERRSRKELLSPDLRLSSKLPDRLAPRWRVRSDLTLTTDRTQSWSPYSYLGKLPPPT